VNEDGIIAKARAAVKHTEANGGINTTDVFAFLSKAIRLREPEPGYDDALADFAHHIGGYASVYWTYDYSMVYAQDLFTEFQKHGILNKEVGARYRKFILEPSGLNSGFKKLRDFLGREPNEDAFLENNGFQFS